MSFQGLMHCLQELSIYGKLRKVSICGPVSMFRSLLVTWKGKYPPHVIAKRVKDFFRFVKLLTKFILKPHYTALQMYCFTYAHKTGWAKILCH